MKKLSIFLLVIIVVFFLAMTTRAVMGTGDQREMIAGLQEKGQAFESSQERARYALTVEIVDYKKFVMDDFAKLSLPDLSYKDGHYFSVFPPGVSFILAPAYWLGKTVGEPMLFSFAMPALAMVLAVIFIFLLACRTGLDNFSAFISALIFPLATIAWSYSVTLYAHVFSALCVVASLYFATKIREGSDWNYFAVWLLYGISILIDFPNAVIMAPVILFMIFESFSLRDTDSGKKILSVRPAFIYLIAPFLILVELLLFYNYRTVGSFFDLSHNYRITDLVSQATDYRFAISQALNFKYLENGLFTLLLSKSRGILLYSPILILSIAGVASLYRSLPKITKVIAAIVLLNIVVYASFYDPWGGWAYGPRYLIISMPLLALLVGHSFQAYRKNSLFLLIFFGLFAASFGIALLGALTTNLLPPPPEAGQQISFLANIPLLLSNSPGNIAYNWLNQHFTLSVVEYFILISAIFSSIILPAFVLQLLRNFLSIFKGKKEVSAVTVIREEAHAV